MMRGRDIVTWLVPQLDKRLQIGKPIQTPNDDGGFDFSFDAVLTVWGGLKPVNFKGSSGNYIRGEQINEAVSHKATVRKSAVDSLGREYGLGFSSSFGMEDLMSLKSDYFLFLETGSTVKGRLFRIHGMVNNNEQNEYLVVDVEEIEEKGAGYPA